MPRPIMTSSSLPASEGPRAFAAVDLGASSGRVVLGTYRDGALDMTRQRRIKWQNDRQ